jgi:glycosyltransferase involved in cell wall biosynthesis
MEPLTGSHTGAGGPASAEAGSLGAVVSAIVPCLDEESAIDAVVRDVLAKGVAEVIVVDGGSRDRTVAVAREAGARVVAEPRRGYGRAVMSGIAAARSDATILLFVDGDGSDHPRHIPELVRPIVAGEADFVHGTRVRGEREAGSMSAPQLLAGWLAGRLIRAAYGVRFTDMSPYRAIRRDLLERLGMREETYGWNLEMLMRVAASGARTLEVPVGQRRRAGGVSKVSGNLGASVRAALVIATTFLRLARHLGKPGSSKAEERRPEQNGHDA